jgi:hypothetical protein
VAEATRATVRMLPGGGDIVEKDGRFYLSGPPFVAWACERQGYIKRVVR